MARLLLCSVFAARRLDAPGPLESGDPLRPSSRAFGVSGEALDELQAGLRDLAPSAVDGQSVSATGDLDEFGDVDVLTLLMGRASEMARGTVLPFSPDMISRGPRTGLSVSTLASDQGLRLAAAAWNSGAPGAATRLRELQAGQRDCSRAVS